MKHTFIPFSQRGGGSFTSNWRTGEKSSGNLSSIAISIDIFSSFVSLILNKFPISRIFAQFQESIVTSGPGITIVQGGTGSGKTAILPAFIARILHTLDVSSPFYNGIVMVSIPLRSAAIEVHKFVTDIFPSLASNIGLRCDGISSPNFNTAQIKYMTTRTVLNHVIYMLKTTRSALQWIDNMY